MPLHLPYCYYTYKLLAIDPGNTHTGFAIFDIESQTGSVIKIEAFTVNLDKLDNVLGLDEEIVPDRVIRQYKLKHVIMYYLNLLKPITVIYESPFYNRFRPTAYGPLMELMGVSRSAVLEFNQNIPFITVEPLLVKKAIGTKSIKGKISVKEAIFNNPDIVNVIASNLNDLDEHSLDAIAVGYAYLKFKMEM